MQVTVLRHPTDDDWRRCKMLALSTMGRESEKDPTEEWKHLALRSMQSPTRTLMYTIRLEGVPYYVSVHLVRHKVGVEHYVRSQRNDRQDEYDRTKAPQDAPVTHIIEANALISMAGMRLCGKACKETREWMRLICEAVALTNPEMAPPFLRPKCRQRDGYCDEFSPCRDREATGWFAL